MEGFFTGGGNSINGFVLPLSNGLDFKNITSLIKKDLNEKIKKLFGKNLDQINFDDVKKLRVNVLELLNQYAKNCKQVMLDKTLSVITLHDETSRQLFHCDIKPDNFFLSKLDNDLGYKIRLGDFGGVSSKKNKKSG